MQVPLLGWLQIFFFAGFIETSGFFSGKSVAIGFQKDSTQDGEPGNYGVGFPNFLGKVTDPAARASKLSAELANGRLAMMAIIGMFFQDGLTGSAWGDWALYTASPLRTGIKSPGYNTLPETEKRYTGFQGVIGDQAPIGFWDPLGYATDGDVAKFKKRREVELKHGRVAMFATIGYIVPEYYRFDGFLSTSQNIKFADVPNGLKALSVVPQAGILQFFAFIGFIELAVNKPTGEPGNYGKGFLGLGTLGFSTAIQNPDVRVTKLNAELANGRLAMMAIIGMLRAQTE